MFSSQKAWPCPPVVVFLEVPLLFFKLPPMRVDCADVVEACALNAYPGPASNRKSHPSCASVSLPVMGDVTSPHLTELF